MPTTKARKTSVKKSSKRRPAPSTGKRRPATTKRPTAKAKKTSKKASAKRRTLKKSEKQRAPKGLFRRASDTAKAVFAGVAAGASVIATGTSDAGTKTTEEDQETIRDEKVSTEAAK